MFGIMFKEIFREGLTEECIEKKVFEIMRNLANNPFSKVKFFPYQAAYVVAPIFDAERESMLPLEYMLAIKAGVRTDNHTCYEVYDGYNSFYVWCHDGVFRLGRMLELCF